MIETERLLEKIKSRFPGISCAYRDASGNTATRQYGLADIEENVPVEESTAFPANSISKFITAICVMKAQEQGLLDIDEPVNQYLGPWKLLTLKGDESQATIRALLCHTAGILDGADGYYGLRKNDPPISLADILEGRTPYNNRPVRTERTPGTVFEYSDGGYCVLQLLLEEIMEKPFEDIAKEWIFDPLCLEHTFFASPENVAYHEDKNGIATGYDENGRPIPGKYPLVPDLAASGVWSTPKELLKISREFVKAFHGKSFWLKERSAREIAKPNDAFGWIGLGVFMGGENEIVSRGWGENGQSMMRINYSTGEIAVAMTNRNPGVDQSGSGVEWLVDSMAKEETMPQF